jgi:two-component system, OmpR family, response regulator QseB
METFKDLLIVDDDASIRALLLTAMTRGGFTCDEAADGMRAIEQLGSTRYRVMLLDLMMPRLDGAGVLRALARMKPAAVDRPRVIVLTASSDHDNLGPLAAMIDQVMAKPFDLQELTSTVKTLVSASHGAIADQLQQPRRSINGTRS